MPFASLALIAGATAAFAAKAVIVLSMDGLGFKQLETIDPDFVRASTVTSIRPPFPSQTFPSHSTLATGAPPSRHGVFANRPVKGERARGFSTAESRNESRRLQVGPLWVTAAHRGLQSEVRLWPVSYGAWSSSSTHRHQERFVEETFPEIARDVAARLRAWDRSSDFLYMSWTPGLDHVGHLSGPLSGPLRRTWAELKEQVAALERELSAGLKPGDRLAVVFVGDHGMQEVTTLVPLSRLGREFAPDEYEADHRSTHALFYAPLTAAEVSTRAARLGIPLEIRPVETKINDVVAIGALPPGWAFGGELQPGDTCRPNPRRGGWFDCAGIGQHGYPPEHTPWMDAAFWVWTSTAAALPKAPAAAEKLPAFVWAAFQAL